MEILIPGERDPSTKNEARDGYTSKNLGGESTQSGGDMKSEVGSMVAGPGMNSAIAETISIWHEDWIGANPIDVNLQEHEAETSTGNEELTSSQLLHDTIISGVEEVSYILAILMS